jgi:hypothetical protein
MTDQQLRELLRERVADLAMPDLTADAWRSGRLTRRRERWAVVGCAALLAGVAATGVAVLGDQGRPTGPTPAPGVSTSGATATPDAPDAPDTLYRGAQVWLAPATDEEGGLTRLADTGLPGEIDLSPGRPAARGIGRAVGVLGVWPDGGLSRVVAVGADGGSYSLDLTGVVGPVADEQGNVISALTQEGLAPDGRYVFFVQERSLEVYDFQTDAWIHIATPAWLAEGARWVGADRIHVPERLGSTAGGTTYDATGREVAGVAIDGAAAWTGTDEAFGPLKAGPEGVARGHYLAGGVALGGTTYSGLDAVVATVGAEHDLLVFAPLDQRWKGCCPVVGWSGPDIVLLESRHSSAHVLAWRVGTHDVRLVSSIVGWVAGAEAYVASWALGGR